MTTLSLIDMFIAYENKKKLFTLEVNNFNYWPYIRESIYLDILSQKEQTSQAHTTLSNKTFKERLLLKAKEITYWFSKNPIVKLKRSDIFVLSHPRRVKVEGFYDCPYTDLLLRNINYSSLVLEKPLLGEHYKPVQTKNIYYTDFLNFIAGMQIFFEKKIKRRKVDDVSRRNLRNILLDINTTFNVNISVEKYLTRIEHLFISEKIYYHLYKRILKRVKPKLILEVVSYLPDRIIVNKVAKELGITVVELQHGLMGKNHIAYNMEGVLNIPSFPDYIFLFGQYWKDTTRFPLDESRLKVVGWPYFEQKVISNNVEKTRQIKEKITLLFISQGTIGIDLSRLAVEVSENINLDQYRIIYKLHPGEFERWKQEYPWLNNPKIDVMDQNSIDIHECFAQSDIQIGVYSTALFEGLGYGLKTIIVNLQGAHYLEDLYKHNMAVLVNGSTEIIRESEPERIWQDTTYLWASNSIKHMNREIDKIINK